MSEAAVLLSGIVKRFRGIPALAGLDLEVPVGSVFALLGPNGAGKTTTLRIIMGLVRPDAGSGRVLGVALGQRGYPPISLMQRIGYVPERFSLWENMTGKDLVKFCGELNPHIKTEVVDRYVRLFKLPMNFMVKRLSAGQKSQLALALAMSSEPDLLVLDEPTRGLDPENRRKYLQALLEDAVENGRTVILSTREISHVERIADRVAILKDGKVILSGGIDEIIDNEKRVRVTGQFDDVSLSRISSIRGVRRLCREGSSLLIHVSGDVREVRESLTRLPFIAGIQVLDQNLEEVFLSYTADMTYMG
ncbi:MAG TPA: ABC transporter ATP-binding protein [Firmicutes bacterium]|nr:ABC transporter ATP-binding protein [Candidatus Fermentithermobacillaceae bacterium]